jgi:hypothetical protein
VKSEKGKEMTRRVGRLSDMNNRERHLRCLEYTRQIRRISKEEKKENFPIYSLINRGSLYIIYKGNQKEQRKQYQE